MTFHTFNSYDFPQKQTFRILGGTDPQNPPLWKSIMIAGIILFLSTFRIMPLQPITLASDVEDM
jgi:hypothetical protein